MRLELSLENLSDVVLEAKRVTNESLDVALVHEQTSLLFTTGSTRHLVEQQRRTRIHPLGNDLQTRKVGHHDQVALEPLRKLLRQVAQCGLYNLLEVSVRR